MTHTTALAPVLAEHIAAVNAFDENAIVATFAGDALVNDVHREFWGRDAIRGWVARELVGDRVTIAVTEVLDHHGDTIVRGRYDGNYDKTNLPDELILTSYFTVRDGKIVTFPKAPRPRSLRRNQALGRRPRTGTLRQGPVRQHQEQRHPLTAVSRRQAAPREPAHAPSSAAKPRSRDFEARVIALQARGDHGR
jgi:hypothetical protein